MRRLMPPNAVVFGAGEWHIEGKIHLESGQTVWGVGKDQSHLKYDSLVLHDTEGNSFENAKFHG